jgi:hypothetical protein
MMRKSANKNVVQGKDQALSCPPPGELTCSEGQVEDLLSAGESTEEERIAPPTPTERKPLPRNAVAAVRKRD